jgi:ArsR family transcriptional regulator, arsenate/arsenite/antimonite-responsive transcriptional repressor
MGFAVDATSAVDALGALAQETRLGIFRLLVQKGPSGMAAGAIADRLGIPGATLSFHLARLTHAGLIAPRRESRSIIYSANFRGMNALIAFLTENCCAGEGASCVPARPFSAKAERAESSRSTPAAGVDVFANPAKGGSQ